MGTARIDDARRQARVTRRIRAQQGVPGRLRHAVAELLSDMLGRYVDPTYVRPVQGWYRSSPYADVYRWQYSEMSRISLGCWETMTEFVRDGKKYGIDHDGEEVWVKYPRKSKGGKK